MAEKSLLDIDILRQLVDYDSETGEMTWLPRRPGHYSSGGKFSPEYKARIFNERHAGKPALTARHSSGYRMGGILGHKVFAHRVAWALSKNRWPDGVIDHKNGNPDDNRIANLRDVSRAINQKNMSLKKRKNRLPVGVSYVKTGKRLKRYCASAQVDKKKVSLGYYRTPEEASKARQDFALSNGFTKRHGAK